MCFNGNVVLLHMFSRYGWSRQWPARISPTLWLSKAREGNSQCCPHSSHDGRWWTIMFLHRLVFLVVNVPMRIFKLVLGGVILSFRSFSIYFILLKTLNDRKAVWSKWSTSYLHKQFSMWKYKIGALVSSHSECRPSWGIWCVCVQDTSSQFV